MDTVIQRGVYGKSLELSIDALIQMNKNNDGGYIYDKYLKNMVYNLNIYTKIFGFESL